MLWTSLFQWRRKDSIFFLVFYNVTILFVGTKRSRSILYQISTNTQWEVDSILDERMHTDLFIIQSVRILLYSFCLLFFLLL
jgi:hypothetical protein